MALEPAVAGQVACIVIGDRNLLILAGLETVTIPSRVCGEHGEGYLHLSNGSVDRPDEKWHSKLGGQLRTLVSQVWHTLGSVYARDPIP